VNALWLRPLPVQDADRIVLLRDNLTLSSALLRPFEGAVVAQVDEYKFGLQPSLAAGPGRQTLEVSGVSPSFFHFFGIPVHGRDFEPDDDRPGAEPVGIISHRVWLRDFGGSSSALGAAVSAGSVSIRVVGIAPAGFEGARRGDRADIWIPADLRRRLAPTSLDVWGVPLIVYARLPAGRTAADAEREMTLNDPRHLPRKLVALTDVFGTPRSPTVVIREGRALAVVAGVACLVLIGGCATLATLILVHYERRHFEFATKAALGASKGRLLRELGQELLGVAVLGAGAAAIIAHLILRIMPALSWTGGVDLSRLDLSIDWRVSGAAILTTLGTCAVAGWIPLARSTRGTIARSVLTGPATTASAVSQRLRQLLLGTQVASAVIVVASAALFVQAVLHGFGTATGFDLDHTLFVRVDVASGYASMDLKTTEWPDLLAARRRQIRDALQSVPGVQAVVDGQPPLGPEPMASLDMPMVLEVDGQEKAMRVGRVNSSEAGWLSTLGVPLLAGRELTAADAAAKPLPTIVTASLAGRLWPDANPIGQVLRSPSRAGGLLIVGVARDFAFGSLLSPASGVLVTAWNLNPGMTGRWIVRAEHPNAIVPALSAVIRTAVSDVATIQVSTSREVVAQDLGRERAGAWFFSGFGLVALILGLGSVFGLVGYLAESRYKEFGVRMALGASPWTLVQYGMIAAIVPVASGVTGGLLVAAWVSELFASRLVGLGALNIWDYAAIAGTMLGGATVAAIMAAWRLRRLSPVEALRTV
jgi:predicted permease